MRQIVGQSKSIKLGSYKVVFDKAKLENAMQCAQQHRMFKKPKRFRSAFTTEQINYLEKEFNKFPYINREHRKAVATFLKIEERPIKIWFQNRRMKEKRENHKECNDETNRNPQEFVKEQLNNVHSLPSTNYQRLYPLPISLSTSDTLAKANTNSKKANKVEHKEILITGPENSTKLCVDQKSSHPENYYKEASNEEHLSPYFHHKPTNNITLASKINLMKHKRSREHSNTSAEFSINLCKKYKQKRAATNPMVYGNITQGQKAKKMDPKKGANLCSPAEDRSGSQKPNLSYLPQSKASNQVCLKNPAYYPVMPTVYAPPLISSGGLLWKPVDFIPVMATSTPPVTVPQPQGAPPHEQSKNCKCNCHGSIHHVPLTLSPNLQNAYNQYMITLPYQHTS